MFGSLNDDWRLRCVGHAYLINRLAFIRVLIQSFPRLRHGISPHVIKKFTAFHHNVRDVLTQPLFRHFRSRRLNLPDK